MKLHKMIEMYLKYDNMHINVIINVFICINNHVNSCIKCILSIRSTNCKLTPWELAQAYISNVSPAKISMRVFFMLVSTLFLKA